MGRSRDIATFLSKTEQDNTDNLALLNSSSNLGLDSAQVTTIATDAGLAVYSTLDSLPISSLTSGDQAYVEENNRLYISNGTGWYNVSLVNLSPTFDSNINSTFTIVDSQTPLIIRNPASDSDDPAAVITYGGTLSDSGQYMVTLTRDSSVWTFTPLSSDSVYNNVTLGNIPDSDGGDFTYTFTASDGINQATKLITITYDGLNPEPAVNTVTRSAASVNEGSTFSFTVTTVDTPDNYRVYWRVQGTSSTNDISSPQLTSNNRIEEGYITVTNNAATSATFTASADLITEGSETFIFDVTRLADENGDTVVSYTNTKRDTITINDTSVAPSLSAKIASEATAPYIYFSFKEQIGTDADGTLYSTFENQGSAGDTYDLELHTNANRPEADTDATITGGTKALAFNSSDNLRFTKYTLPTNWTFVFIAHQSSTRMIGFGGSDDNTFFGWSGSNNTSFLARAGNDAGMTQSSLSSLAKMKSFVVRKSGNNLDYWDNSNTKVSYSTTFTTSGFDIGQIGARGSGPTQASTGFLGDVAIYTTALSDADCAAMAAALNTKYNV